MSDEMNPAVAAESSAAAPPESQHAPSDGSHGGSRELLKLALPLILSQSFMTIQIAVDRVLLSRHNPDEVAASFPAVNGFFSGRGDTWTVLGIDAIGTAVNVCLALVLIFGRFGIPEMGIEGAGIATVVGSWTSALFGLLLFCRKRFREQFNTLAGWK